MARSRLRIHVSTAVFLSVVLVSAVRAEFQLGSQLTPDEQVRKLEVSITVGRDGEDLAEPVALDLGLGFPFWLHPVGRERFEKTTYHVTIDNSTGTAPFNYVVKDEPFELDAGESKTHDDRQPIVVHFIPGDAEKPRAKLLVGGTFAVTADPRTRLWDLVPVRDSSIEQGPVPFGAVPQSTTANTTIAAGNRETFSFDLNADHDGNDQYGTTSQLLDGVLIGDISRIGITSRGLSAWVLESYEIKVNGMLLAANDRVGARVNVAQQGARDALFHANRQRRDVHRQITDLEALKETNLATNDDVNQLELRRDELIALDQAARWYDGQLDARYPWFVEPQFEPSWRGERYANSVKVRVVTSDRKAASTRNRVYFRTGGRKYLLSSYARPLASEFGRQAFELDLLAGPLPAENLRDIGLGMLAHPFPLGEVPDRWDPVELHVEVNGEPVYSTKDHEQDDRSLASIHLVPPTHQNEGGELVSNRDHAAVETFVWLAGSGLGLDSGGQPLQLGDPQQTEPLATGNTDNSGDEITYGYEPIPADGDGARLATDGGSGYVDGTGLTTDGGSGYVDDAGYGYDDPGYGYDEGYGYDPGYGYDNTDGGGVLDPGYVPQGGLTSQTNQNPIGTPAQAFNVRFLGTAWRQDQQFTMRWDVAGDARTITGFNVQLLNFEPDNGSSVIEQQYVGPSEREATIPCKPQKDIYYVTPYVTPISNDPNLSLQGSSLQGRPGPARAVFPANTPAFSAAPSPVGQLTLSASSKVELQDGTQATENVVNQPATTGRAVWLIGPSRSGADTSFLVNHGSELEYMPNSAPGTDVAVRSGPNDKHVSLSFQYRFTTDTNVSNLGTLRFLAYAGFLQLNDSPNSATFKVTSATIWKRTSGSGLTQGLDLRPLVSLPSVAVSTNEPQKRLTFDIDPNVHLQNYLGPSSTYDLELEIKIQGGPADAQMPPALLGARMIEVEN